MKRSHIIAGVLIVIAAVTSAEIPRLTLPPKKGAIIDVWIEPADPTSATAVTLYVSLADCLQLDRLEIRKTATIVTVKMYWNDLPDGDSGSAGSPPMQHEEPLGVLAPGAYSVSIQSFYQGRFVDADRLSFRVTKASLPGPMKNIDSVWIEPEEPTTGDTVALHVAGQWPTTGYSLNAVVMLASQGNVTLEMYWKSPSGPVATAVTPYDYEAALRNLREGTYAVRVESNLDRQLVDWAEMSFEVMPAPPDSTPDDPGWPWNVWPWDFGDWSW